MALAEIYFPTDLRMIQLIFATNVPVKTNKLVLFYRKRSKSSFNRLVFKLDKRRQNGCRLRKSECLSESNFYFPRITQIFTDLCVVILRLACHEFTIYH